MEPSSEPREEQAGILHVIEHIDDGQPDDEEDLQYHAHPLLFPVLQVRLLSGNGKRLKDFSEERLKALETKFAPDTLAPGDDPGEL